MSTLTTTTNTTPPDTAETGAKLRVSLQPLYTDDVGLAEMTPLSRAWFQLARVRGEGPPYARVGRRCVYKISDVEQWLATHVAGGAK